MLLALLLSAHFAFADDVNADAGDAQTGAELKTIKREEDARCVPQIKPDTGGEIEGFKCWEISSGLREAGVRNGDLIVSVDGQKLSSTAGAKGSFQHIRERQYQEIVISRYGIDLTLKKTP